MKFVLVVNDVTAEHVAWAYDVQAKSENRVRVVPNGSQTNNANDVRSNPMTPADKKLGRFDNLRLEWEDAGRDEALKLLHRIAPAASASA